MKKVQTRRSLDTKHKIKRDLMNLFGCLGSTVMLLLALEVLLNFAEGWKRANTITNIRTLTVWSVQ